MTREAVADSVISVAAVVAQQAGRLRTVTGTHVRQSADPDRMAIHAESHALALRMEALSDDIAALSARLRTTPTER